MTAFEFVADLEFYSEQKLSAEETAELLQDCRRILHIEDDVLRNALRVARKQKNFDLDFIEAVALQLKQRALDDNHQTKLAERSWSTSLSSLSGLGCYGSDFREPRNRRRQE